MIAGSDRPGWFCSTDAGFSFAQQIQVDSMTVYGCRAKLSSSYINFESLHLFSGQTATRTARCGSWLGAAITSAWLGPVCRPTAICVPRRLIELD